MIYWLRSLFCKHNYVFEKNTSHYWNKFDKMPYKYTKTYICSKCLATKRITL